MRQPHHKGQCHVEPRHRRRQDADNLAVVERAIWPDELATADEIFVTGSAAEVTAIGQIAEHRYTVGPITRQLRDDYEKLVRTPVAVAA